MEALKGVSKLSPDFIAFEDPEMMKNGNSISKTKSRKTKQFVRMVKKKSKIIPLCGAGVSNHEDVIAAMKLGAKGVDLCYN